MTHYENGDMLFPARTELYSTIEKTRHTVNLSLMMRLLKPEYQEEVASMLLHRIHTGQDPAFKSQPLATIYAYLTIYVLGLEPTREIEQQHPNLMARIRDLWTRLKKLLSH